jgi:uncharacterized protein (TIGR02118 family)
MLIVLGFYKRKAGLSYEAFSSHWKNVHGPLFLGTPNLVRYFRRYVQHHLTPNTVIPGYQPLDFDGFSESWFDDLDSRREFLRQPELNELIKPDERKFIDTDATRIQMFDTQVVQLSGGQFPNVLDSLLSAGHRSE